MKDIHLSLFHRVVPPTIESSTAPYPTVVLLHGRGTDENDLLGLTPYLDKRMFVISVRAPHRFSLGRGYAWYEFRDVGSPDPEQFAESHERLTTFLTDIRKVYPIDTSRLFLFGFSMGTVMAYAIALTKPEIVRGIVAHSGYIPEDSGLQFRREELENLNVFIAHGLHDPVIPISFARQAREFLLSTSARLTYREYEIGHSVSDDSITDIVGWLTQKIDGAELQHR